MLFRFNYREEKGDLQIFLRVYCKKRAEAMWFAMFDSPAHAIPQVKPQARVGGPLLLQLSLH